MSIKDYDADYVVLSGSGLVFLGSLYAFSGFLWHATLSAEGPTTTISSVETVRSGRNGHRTIRYIRVPGGEVVCGGAIGREGTVVRYDAAMPSRCREPERLGTPDPIDNAAMAGMTLGLGGLFYFVISFLFLSDRAPRRR